ncbi:MAG: PilZ domain-containing protein [Myxococcales bacterium]|nr:PilZ domain-containing protein [Myxococcales bacterium]
MTQLSGRQHTRIHYRVPVQLLTQLDGGPQRVPGSSLDLSEGGIRIAAPARVDVGEPVRCSMTLDGRETELTGRVAWVAPEGDGGGIGVCWSDLGTRDTQALRHIIDRAREGYRRVELHFDGIDGPIFARARPTDEGVRLSVALPILEERSGVSFRFDDDAPLLRGRVGAVAVERVAGNRRLCIDVDASAGGAVRHRKHTQYGDASEIAHALRRHVAPSAPNAPNAPDAQPDDDVTIPGLPRRRSTLLVAALAAMGGAAATWAIVASLAEPTREVRPLSEAPRAVPPRAQPLQVGAAIPETVAGTAIGAEAAAVAVAVAETETEDVAETVAEAETEDVAETVAETETKAGTGTGATADNAAAVETRIRAPATVAAVAPAPRELAVATARADNDSPRRVAEDVSHLPLGVTAPSPTRPSVEVEGDTTHLTLPLEGDLTGMRSRIWADPLALALDLPGGLQTLAQGSYRLDEGGIRYVRLNRRADAVLLRVMLQRPIDSYAVTLTDGTLRIRIAHRREQNGQR